MKKRIIHIDSKLKQAVSPRQAWHYHVLPKKFTGDILELYIDKSRNINGIKNELEVVIGRKVLMEPVDSSWIEESLFRHYPASNEQHAHSNIPKLITDKEKYILTLIEEALKLDSSDIHFEAQENQSVVRYRVDGNLVEKYTISKNDYPAVVNAIKIKSNLDIAEKRLPQDGRLFFSSKDKRVDVRVSIIPTIHGEKIVFRLLNKDTGHIGIETIGFSKEQLQQYRTGFLRSHGLVLISGPTGSGKTTTLYATLKQLNTSDKNILTIEDPIEYTLEGINQVQLKEGIGLTFPVALRTFLRLDPDIIMVGEIRDPETAGVAIRSALTGHLVLSTIHTNSAWGIVSRLIDMAIPDYLIAATLNVAVAQRLVRLLCPFCKKPAKTGNGTVKRMVPGWNEIQFREAGCRECNFTGFRGRRAIFEVIGIDARLREMIRQKEKGQEEIRIANKYNTLSQQAVEVFKKGETTFDEILPILLNE